jgi:hypothetical protein
MSTTFEELQRGGMQPSLLLNKLHIGPKPMSRIMKRILVLENGCWLWTGEKLPSGYGRVKVRSIRDSHMMSHRLTYQLVFGAIGADVVLHHLTEEKGCIGKPCCHPYHLQKTNGREHIRDLTTKSFAYINARKTHCLNGHPFDEKNTWVNSRGERACRACALIRSKATYWRKRNGVRSKMGPPLKTFCIRGHAMEGKNLIFRKRRSDQLQDRACRACNNLCQKIHNLKRSRRPPADLEERMADLKRQFAYRAP